jgi:hypothetical protein
MLTEKEIDRLNGVLKNKVFKYSKGLFDYDLIGENDFDFKFQILGYKKMISVGEYYDYLRVSVTLLNFRDILSQKVFLRAGINGDFFNKYFRDNMYYFRNNLRDEIRTIMTMFEPNARITIEDVEIDSGNEKEPLQEQKMTRQPIREIVKSIIKLFKENDEGEFTLPEDLGDDEMVYVFKKIKTNFTVELVIEQNPFIKGFFVDGNLWRDDDTIEIIIEYNPEEKTKILYDLVGRVNEVLAHEMRHIVQGEKDMFDLDIPEEEDPYKYYTQPHELDALKYGFKRISKLSKKPLDVVIKDWFINHKDIHRLNDDEMKKVIEKIINY